MAVPRWFCLLVLSLLIPAYSFAAISGFATATSKLTGAAFQGESKGELAELESTAAPASLTVDLSGELSDCSDDMADHFAAPFLALYPAKASSTVRIVRELAPPATYLDQLLRPPPAAARLVT